MSKLKAVSSLLSLVGYHGWTLFLFTKSDIKTILIPITCLAAASAPLASYSRLLPTMFWIWIHLLQLDVSNQTLAPGEDIYNKSYRPLPAKRISLRAALILRWVLPLPCLAWSTSYSKEVLCASFVLCALTYIYDEMGFAAGHWAGKNIMNAMGYACFEIGACLIIGNDIHFLDYISLVSVLCSIDIVATTIQAQDFKDIIGDAAVGRRTLPLIHPSIARPTLVLMLAIWSIGLSKIWGLDKNAAVAFNLLGLAVGVSFAAKNTVEEDQRNYYLYNVWLSLAHLLPAYYRFVAIS
ncbi:UbiA prenyltransferase family [Phellopilus nigrolimitatus]|nr:UbiA prenyltransferase family [Phellopilus nigrolimitatus]